MRKSHVHDVRVDMRGPDENLEVVLLRKTASMQLVIW